VAGEDAGQLALVQLDRDGPPGPSRCRWLSNGIGWIAHVLVSVTRARLARARAPLCGSGQHLRGTFGWLAQKPAMCTRPLASPTIDAGSNALVPSGLTFGRLRHGEDSAGPRRVHRRRPGRSRHRRSGDLTLGAVLSGQWSACRPSRPRARPDPRPDHFVSLETSSTVRPCG